jgi:hypothetical protein
MAGFVEQAQVSGVFRAFAVFSHSLFTESFLATSSMQCAGTPRVYQLWTFAGLRPELGESRGRDVRFFQERFEAWTASVLFINASLLAAHKV